AGFSIDINECSATGGITVNSDKPISSSSNSGIGGLFGHIVGTGAGRNSIDNSFTTGDIMISSGDTVLGGVGGLVGQSGDNPLDITLSYSTGDITVDAVNEVDDGVGGLVGRYFSAGDTDRSYSSGNISVTS